MTLYILNDHFLSQVVAVFVNLKKKMFYYQVSFLWRNIPFS